MRQPDRHLQAQRRQSAGLLDRHPAPDRRHAPRVTHRRTHALERRPDNPGRHPSTRVTAHRVWPPPVTQAFSSVGLVHAVRHCRVSGLSMRQVPRRGPSWRCVDRIHDACARSMALRCEPVFPIPSRSTVCPCLSSDLPASPTATRPALSGGGGSPGVLLFRHQRPHDTRHPVGQRHGSFVLPRRAAQRTTAMASVISSRLGSRWPNLRYLAQPRLAAGRVLARARPRSPGRAGRSPSAAQRPEPPSR